MSGGEGGSVGGERDVCLVHGDFMRGIETRIEDFKDSLRQLVTSEISSLRAILMDNKDRAKDVEDRLNKQIDILWDGIRSRDKKIEGLQMRVWMFSGGIVVLNAIFVYLLHK